MINVEDRIPTPGQEGQVTITPAAGDPITGVLAMADNPSEQGTPWSHQTGRMLQADIRSYPVAEGVEVVPGDVVDVSYNNETDEMNITTNVSSLENLKVVLKSNNWPAAAEKYLSLARIDSAYSFFAYVRSTSDGLICGLISNADGEAVDQTCPAISSFVNIRCAVLSETLAVVCADLSENAYIYPLAISTGSEEISYADNSGINAVGSYGVPVSLSDSSILWIRNNNGLKACVCTVSNTAITKGTDVALSGNTNASYISTTLLPDDDSGNKRVCVCYANGTYGGTGMAVVCSINGNTVTWGTPITFYSGSNGISAALSCCTSGNDVIVTFNRYIPSGTDPLYQYVCLLKVSGTSITALTPASTGVDSNNYASIVQTGESSYALAFCRKTPSVTGVSLVVTRNGDLLEVGEPFDFNKNNPINFPSLASLDNNRVLIVYSDVGNSNYGTSTILTVRGDLIAGGFVYNSGQAIALTSASAGETCEVIFSGVTQLPGLTAGHEITSSGVYGYCPIDGWIWVKPWWDTGNVIFGSFVGNGTAHQTIDVGVPLKAVFIVGQNVSFALMINTGWFYTNRYKSFSSGSGYDLGYYDGNGPSTSQRGIYGTSFGIGYGGASNGSMAASGVVYHYIAFY